MVLLLEAKAAHFISLFLNTGLRLLLGIALTAPPNLMQTSLSSSTECFGFLGLSQATDPVILPEAVNTFKLFRVVPRILFLPVQRERR